MGWESWLKGPCELHGASSIPSKLNFGNASRRCLNEICSKYWIVVQLAVMQEIRGGPAYWPETFESWRSRLSLALSVANWVSVITRTSTLMINSSIRESLVQSSRDIIDKNDERFWCRWTGYDIREVISRRAEPAVQHSIFGPSLVICSIGKWTRNSGTVHKAWILLLFPNLERGVGLLTPLRRSLLRIAPLFYCYYISNLMIL